MIGVIDYGMGNLRSVTKALEMLGGKTRIISTPREVSSADKIVLPGVGAFGKAMGELKQRNLINSLCDFVCSGKPFLGICLGLQLLFEKSDESPNHQGLGIIKGAVRKFNKSQIKVPHMGWNSVTIKRPHPLLKNVPDNSYFYFVHSYYAAPEDDHTVSASCRYGDNDFPAMIGVDNLFATQFHPEKSQAHGLTILNNFTKWAL